MALLVLGLTHNPCEAVTFYPDPADLDGLDHHYAYTWGIDWSLPEGHKIKSLTLNIEDINNWTDEGGRDRLFIHLLDDPALGVTSFWDGDYPQQVGDPIDYFAGQGILLATYSDTNGSDVFDFTHSFTQDEINTFLAYASNGRAGFAFDPDCHYFNQGISFTIETCPVVPEPATMSLFGFGLFGLLGLKKKKKG